MTTDVKIYFSASIRAGRGDVDLYGRIVKMLGKYGTVLTPYVADPNVADLLVDGGPGKTDKDIHERDVNFLKQCDAIVAEVTQPSLGVGYELGRGDAMGKKILCLYRPQPDKNLSAMIRGADVEGKFLTKDYKEEDLPSVFESFFAKVCKDRKENLD